MSLDQVEAAAPALPVQERARLAQDRAAQIDKGTVTLVTGQELEARLAAHAK